MTVKVPADIRPLIDAAKANGYKVVPSGRSKHMRVLDSKGKVVVDDNGPVIVSGSPGDHRMRDMHVQRFIAAGIIKPEQNPWKPEKGKGADGQPEVIDEEKARRERVRLEGMAEANRERAERTRKIRSRWEPIIARIGGWEKRGTVADAGIILYHFAKTHGRTEAPKSVNSATQLITRVKRGDTLSADSAVCFEILLDDLERKPRDMVARWHDLLREAKGLPARSEAPPAMPLPEPPRPPREPQEPVYEAPVVMEGDVLAEVPTLALEALAQMVRNLPPDSDHQDQLGLAKEILRMELRR